MNVHAPLRADARPQTRGTRWPAAWALGVGVAALLACSPHPAQAGIVGGMSGTETAMLAYAQVTQGAELVVTGTASVAVEPDAARVSLSVTAEGQTASAAAQAASDEAAGVRDALAQAGVAKDDLQTSGVAVWPRYAYAQDGTSSVSSYAATVSFTAEGVTLPDVADVVSAALAAGATQVDEVAYYASTYDEHYAEALAKATASARAKAQALQAAQFGDAGGELVLEKLEEQPTSQAYRYASASGFESASADSAQAKVDVSASINPGTIEIEASVTATYRAWDAEALGRATNEDGQAVDVIGATGGSAASER